MKKIQKKFKYFKSYWNKRISYYIFKSTWLVTKKILVSIFWYWSYCYSLDPRFKKLGCFNNTDKQKANSLLIKKHEEYISNNNIINIEDNENQTEENLDELDDLNKSLMNSIFGKEESDDEEKNEVDVYFNLKAAKFSINPLF